MRLLAASMLMLLLPAAATAAPGDLDRSFGDRGVVTPRGVLDAAVVRTLPGGRIALRAWDAGRVHVVDRRGRRARGVVSQGLSTVPAGGGLATISADYAGGAVAALVVRVRADGRPDARFGNAGSVRIDGFSPTALLGHPDGRLVLIGRRGMVPGTGSAVIRLTRTGSLDPTFGASGEIALPHDLSGTGFAAVDGSLLLVAGGGSLRLSAAGAVERELPSPGLAPVLMADGGGGRILVASTDGTRGRVARLRADGTADPGFAPADLAGLPSGLARDRRGGVVVAATTDFPAAGARGHVIRFAHDGQPDAAFDARARAALRTVRAGWAGGAVHGLVLDARGRVVVSGVHFRAGLTGRREAVIARLRTR